MSPSVPWWHGNGIIRPAGRSIRLYRRRAPWPGTYIRTHAASPGPPRAVVGSQNGKAAGFDRSTERATASSHRWLRRAKAGRCAPCALMGRTSMRGGRRASSSIAASACVRAIDLCMACPFLILCRPCLSPLFRSKHRVARSAPRHAFQLAGSRRDYYFFTEIRRASLSLSLSLVNFANRSRPMQAKSGRYGFSFSALLIGWTGHVQTSKRRALNRQRA